MRALQRAVEWLRPFVETMGWDYVVVWKLGDDPSRFFEWVGCCCCACGNAKVNKTTKRQKKMMMNSSIPLCRDAYILHPIKTKACLALSEFPSSIPLYSGIHGDVVITNQFKWIWIGSGPSTSGSELSSVTELAGTRVLIPVVGGVVELFNAKHISEERKIVDFITAQCQFFWRQESEGLNEPIFSDCQRKCSATSVPICIKSICDEVEFLSPNTVCAAYQSFEASFSSSNPSSEHTSLGSCDGTLKQEWPGTDLSKSFFSSGIASVKCNNSRTIRGSGENGYCSKNLTAERSRRARIKNKLHTLRALVPKISKMNKSAILGDALEYIEELKGKAKSLEEELKQIEEEYPETVEADLKLPIFEETRASKDLYCTADSVVSSCLEPNQKIQVEVNPMSEGDILIKILCKQKRGWFSSLTETLFSSRLTIVDANVTTFNGNALATLVVEGLNTGIYPQQLRDLLIKVVS